MPRYTYFIISPGNELGSFVTYRNGSQGVYIKFGDETAVKLTDLGVRNGYQPHNPDFGVGAVMNADVFGDDRLATQLKRYIVRDLGIAPVPGTQEWFSIEKDAGWHLFYEVHKYNNRILTAGDLQNLKDLLDRCLGAAQSPTAEAAP